MFRGVAALLFRLLWPEPFGLVMNRGNRLWDSRHCLSAGVCPGSSRRSVSPASLSTTKGEAIAAIKRLSELEQTSYPRDPRKALFRFRRMAEDYARHFEALQEGKTRRALGPVRMLNAV